MFRSVTFTLLFGVSLAALAADDEEKFAIPPRAVKMEMTNSTLGKVAPELARKTGIPFGFPKDSAGQTCDGVFNEKPFWFALEMIADQTGNRIVLGDRGRKIALEPRGRSYEVSSVHGAFRVVARQVVGRVLLDSGSTVHEVQLDIHWEPRLPVFRIDSVPRVTKAVDDRGTVLTAQHTGSLSQPTGSLHSSIVRLDGLTRSAKRIAAIDGKFSVTASESMLAYRFEDLTKGKADVSPLNEKKREKNPVIATLKRVEKDEKTWEFELELVYPSNIPKFESFESWTHENRVRLESPAGNTFSADDHEILTQGSRVLSTYRFKEDPKKGLVRPAAAGWKLVYEAPSPPVEFTVPFELKDIPLP
jgi:hypothetical protein